MHLTDEQLMLASQGQGSSEIKRHLSLCEICQARARTHQSLQEKLATFDSLDMPSDRWAVIAETHQAESKESLSIDKKDNSIFWKLSSFALAASLAAVLISGVFLESDNKLHDSTSSVSLAELIEENNQLQKELKGLSESSQLMISASKPLNNKLSRIDDELQRAYINGLSQAEKISLWQQRIFTIRLMIDEQTKKTKNTPIFI